MPGVSSCAMNIVAKENPKENPQRKPRIACCAKVRSGGLRTPSLVQTSDSARLMDELRAERQGASLSCFARRLG